MGKEKFLECGKIQNTHGVRGLVRAESFCDSPAVLAALPTVYFKRDGEYLPRKILRTTRMQDTVLLQLEGIEDMDAAALLKNEVIYAAREDIPLRDGAYFLADLPGLPVLDAGDGRTLGTVRDTQTVGARSYLVVTTEAGERLVPMVPAFVARVDTETGVYLQPIPGLLDDN